MPNFGRTLFLLFSTTLTHRKERNFCEILWKKSFLCTQKGVKTTNYVFLWRTSFVRMETMFFSRPNFSTAGLAQQNEPSFFLKIGSRSPATLCKSRGGTLQQIWLQVGVLHNHSNHKHLTCASTVPFVSVYWTSMVWENA